MNAQSLIGRIRRGSPAWLLSIALHGALLAALSAVAWRVVHRAAPEMVLTLASTPDAAAGRREAPENLTDPGREVGSRDDGTKEHLPAGLPPAPKIGELEQSLMSLSVPDVPAAMSKVPADPARALLAALGTSDADRRTDRRGPRLPVGISQRFGERIGVLRGRGLDVVLVLDATKSMSPYIGQAKRRLRDVLDLVTGLVPGTKFGVVAYKDYCDTYGPNATRSLPLSKDLKKVRAFIDKIIAGGGGDVPEPIHEALRVATGRRMGWTSRRKKVIILVGDSPISSSGRDEAIDRAKTFAKRQSGTINVIDVGRSSEKAEGARGVLPDLADIANAGRGEAFLLKEEKTFWRYLIVSVFGKRFESDVEEIIRRYLKKRDE